MGKKHGITTIRNFDALNDVNNLVLSGRCIAEPEPAAPVVAPRGGVVARLFVQQGSHVAARDKIAQIA